MDVHEINKHLEDFKTTHLDKNFKWRKGQKEAIIEIVLAYFSGMKAVILDCPTGGGKSLIAIASSWILNRYNKDGYILASDISLQEQYEKDFKNYNIWWGSVKGIDNYKCTDNDEKNSLGTCRIRNLSPKSMHCYHTCPYFSARDKASESPTSLLNYAYWLIMMNYVSVNHDESPFIARDFTFCDEGHKLLDIVHNHYTPVFDETLIERIEKLTLFFNLYNVKDHMRDYVSVKNFIKDLKKEENLDTLFDILQKIEFVFETYLSSIHKLKARLKDEYNKDEPPKEWREALRISDWLKDLHCKIEDFNTIIKQTSVNNIVKNPNGDTIKFNCLEESYMMNNYFHKWSGFTVFMSATFADASKYMQSIALKNVKYIKMESTFDFTNSPIYFYNKRKMTYNTIEKNLPWLCATIDNVLDNHTTQNGIIHTASYDLTMKIQNGLSRKNQRRLLIYSGTEEKRSVLKIYKNSKNKVLIGPSLTEGLDLKDDMCRFIIFAKVPYLSLADRFVATKLKIKPDWYREQAILNILQGSGRAIRNADDWAITYVLDGALGDLIHFSRNSFPQEFMKRIIPIST